MVRLYRLRHPHPNSDWLFGLLGFGPSTPIMEPIMAIKIPGTAFQGVRSFGAGAPEAGFYKVSIIKVETNPNDKPGKRRLHVQFACSSL